MASLWREPGGPTHPSAHASVRHARGLKLAVQVEALGRRIQHNAGIVTTNVVKLAVQVETHGRRIQLKAGNVATVVVKLAVQVETLGRRIQLEAGIVATDLSNSNNLGCRAVCEQQAMVSAQVRRRAQGS